MARLQKPELLFQVEEAIRQSGWSLLYITKSTHPARYSINRDGTTLRIKVYIWNITPGGRNRPADEYRIQITGVDHFESEPSARNLVLGWWDEVGVFAGWDIRQHSESLGSSPSFQINESSLRQALLTGFAPYVKANNETAIAFRPDFMGTYIQFLEPLHDSGAIPAEAAVLAQISDDPEEINEVEIEQEVAAERQRALTSTWRAVRAIDFRKRVLTAYSSRCAMCGLQLRLIEGAHILPVDQPESHDHTSNGIALCVLHHRAYDRGLLTFDQSFRVHVNEKIVRALKEAHEADGLTSFRKALRPIIHMPPDKRDRPAHKLVTAANALRGWSL